MIDDAADNAKPDLSTVTIEEMLDEIVARCDAVVVGLCTKADQPDSVRIRTMGNRLICRGLIADMIDIARSRSRGALNDAEEST